MTIPVQIVYRDLERTDAVDAYIRKHLDKLGGTHAGHVTSCRVALEAPHRHKRHGRHYRVRIDMTVPGAELVVDRNPDANAGHDDAYAAIDDAFDHAMRRVVEHVRRARELSR
jgi:ribosomal subunit interface protein